MYSCFFIFLWFLKARNSLVFQCREERFNWEKEKKTEDGENLFFKASANRFWLKLKCYSWFNKVVHGRLSIKWTSWKGNGILTKVG